MQLHELKGTACGSFKCLLDKLISLISGSRSNKTNVSEGPHMRAILPLRISRLQYELNVLTWLYSIVLNSRTASAIATCAVFSMLETTFLCSLNLNPAKLSAINS